MKAGRVPVVLFVFNRPEKLRRLLSILAEVRPTRLLIVADGPRSEDAEDIVRCREVRELVARVDWPCEILRDYADVNLGCHPRVASGMDWAFEQVEEAILLEDDVVPDPSFFRWCGDMLSRYRGNPSVLQVCGRNELGHWDRDGGDHYLIWRGSQWGFATWRHAWRTARDVALPGEQKALDLRLARGEIDPLVAEHFGILRTLAAAGGLKAWDTRWSLQRALIGGLSVVPPVNLVAHRGFDDEATHCRNAADLRGLVPVGRAPEPSGGSKPGPDHDLDRWSLLIELMSTFRDPVMLRRLSRAPGLVVDPQLRHHLAPFAAPAEAMGALRHLRRSVGRPSALDGLLDLIGLDATDV